MSKTLVVIPCYNESTRLNLEDYNGFLLKENHYTFCFVDDGSLDQTRKKLEIFCSENKKCFLYTLDKNVGKAEAIRKVVLNFGDSFDYVAYLDADLSTPLFELKRLFEYLKENNKSFVFGSRIKTFNTNILRKKYRHFFGRIVATLVDEFILKMSIYDTQCGLKILESKLALALFEEKFETKWLFDVELFIRLMKVIPDKETQKDILEEIPLKQWIDTKDSRISLIEFIKTPIDILKLAFLRK